MSKCTKCARCCKKITVTFTPNDYTRILLEAHYGHPVEDVVIRIKHRCKQLDENDRCKIYETRPQKCRDFLCNVANGNITPRLVVEVSDE